MIAAQTGILNKRFTHRKPAQYTFFVKQVHLGWSNNGPFSVVVYFFKTIVEHRSS